MYRPILHDIRGVVPGGTVATATYFPCVRLKLALHGLASRDPRTAFVSPTELATAELEGGAELGKKLAMEAPTEELALQQLLAKAGFAGRIAKDSISKVNQVLTTAASGSAEQIKDAPFMTTMLAPSRPSVRYAEQFSSWSTEMAKGGARLPLNYLPFRDATNDQHVFTYITRLAAFLTWPNFAGIATTAGYDWVRGLDNLGAGVAASKRIRSVFAMLGPVTFLKMYASFFDHPDIRGRMARQYPGDASVLASDFEAIRGLALPPLCYLLMDDSWQNVTLYGVSREFKLMPACIEENVFGYFNNLMYKCLANVVSALRDPAIVATWASLSSSGGWVGSNPFITPGSVIQVGMRDSTIAYTNGTHISGGPADFSLLPYVGVRNAIQDSGLATLNNPGRDRDRYFRRKNLDEMLSTNARWASVDMVAEVSTPGFSTTTSRASSMLSALRPWSSWNGESLGLMGRASRPFPASAESISLTLGLPLNMVKAQIPSLTSIFDASGVAKADAKMIFISERTMAMEVGRSFRVIDARPGKVGLYEHTNDGMSLGDKQVIPICQGYYVMDDEYVEPTTLVHTQMDRTLVQVMPSASYGPGVLSTLADAFSDMPKISAVSVDGDVAKTGDAGGSSVTAFNQE